MDREECKDIIDTLTREEERFQGEIDGLKEQVQRYEACIVRLKADIGKRYPMLQRIQMARSALEDYVVRDELE